LLFKHLLLLEVLELSVSVGLLLLLVETAAVVLLDVPPVLIVGQHLIGVSLVLMLVVGLKLLHVAHAASPCLHAILLDLLLDHWPIDLHHV
jgi:hypothetical protein